MSADVTHRRNDLMIRKSSRKSSIPSSAWAVLALALVGLSARPAQAYVPFFTFSGTDQVEGVSWTLGFWLSDDPSTNLYNDQSGAFEDRFVAVVVPEFFTIQEPGMTIEVFEPPNYQWQSTADIEELFYQDNVLFLDGGTLVEWGYSVGCGSGAPLDLCQLGSFMPVRPVAEPDTTRMDTVFNWTEAGAFDPIYSTLHISWDEASNVGLNSALDEINANFAGQDGVSVAYLAYFSNLSMIDNFRIELLMDGPGTLRNLEIEGFDQARLCVDPGGLTGRDEDGCFSLPANFSPATGAGTTVTYL